MTGTDDELQSYGKDMAGSMKRAKEREEDAKEMGRCDRRQVLGGKFVSGIHDSLQAGHVIYMPFVTMTILCKTLSLS